MPPWLWLWLIGDLAVLIPAEVSNERHQLTLYTGHGEIAPQVTAGTPYVLLLLFTILSGLTYAIFAAGVIATAFPQLRCRRVERRLGLVPDGAEDGAVLAEMQDFVARYDPAIRLRSVVRDDQMAGIYPVSWRTARIAVFRPLPELWRHDREAAQAVLLREVAHRRHGDQLVVGPGSPLVWVMRIWVPAFVVLALAPVVVYAALGGGLLTQAVAGQGAWQLLQPIGLLILPVTALWLAELDADLDRRTCARGRAGTAGTASDRGQPGCSGCFPGRRGGCGCGTPRRGGRAASRCWRPGRPRWPSSSW